MSDDFSSDEAQLKRVRAYVEHRIAQSRTDVALVRDPLKKESPFYRHIDTEADALKTILDVLENLDHRISKLEGFDV